MLAALDADALRHLAALAAANDRPKMRDPEKAAWEMAAMICGGKVPTIGWWRRHRVPRIVPPGPDPTPDEITAVVTDLLAVGVRPEQHRDVDDLPRAESGAA